MYTNFCFFEVSWIKKSSQMLYFLQMYDDNNGRTIVWFLAISWALKTIGNENIFSIVWFQEMSLKREIFVNFLPQKFMTKYSIVSTYSVTCVSENFNMSPVLLLPSSQFPTSNSSVAIASEWPERFLLYQYTCLQ